jgi:hypothetical protein
MIKTLSVAAMAAFLLSGCWFHAGPVGGGVNNSVPAANG